MHNNKQEALSAFFRKLEQLDRLSDSERQAFTQAAGAVNRISAGHDLVREGDRPKFSTLLVWGLAARYNYVQSGGRRITAFHIDGDFIDLHAFLLKTIDHGIKALSDCTVIYFPHEALQRITEEQPHLTRLLWLSTLLDSAIHRQWLVVQGRLRALPQMAHLFCEQLVRARAAGVEEAGVFPLSITQVDLADALGISAVHVNRTLQELRATGLLEWERGVAHVFNEAGLRRLGEFDETYLHPHNEPR